MDWIGLDGWMVILYCCDTKSKSKSDANNDHNIYHLIFGPHLECFPQLWHFWPGISRARWSIDDPGRKGWECVDMTRCEKCDACDMNVKYGDLEKWDRPRGCFCKHSSNFASQKKQNVKLHQPNCYSEEIAKREGKSICQKTWKVALKMTESVIVGYLWKDTVYRISTASVEKEKEWNQINMMCLLES